MQNGRFSLKMHFA